MTSRRLQRLAALTQGAAVVGLGMAGVGVLLFGCVKSNPNDAPAPPPAAEASVPSFLGRPSGPILNAPPRRLIFNAQQFRGRRIRPLRHRRSKLRHATPAAHHVEGPRPIGQATPVPPRPQYPSGFLARYC